LLVAFRDGYLGQPPEIARLAMSEELAWFRERGLELTVSDEAFGFLVRRGLRKALGARPLKKTVQKFIGDAIRDAMKRNHPAFSLFRPSITN
jgi:ATP-dependent Clp protease ATP-binding subunit ClpE